MGRDGRRWRVGRQWTPRIGSETVMGRFRRRYREVTRRVDVADADPGCLEMFEEGLVIGLVGIAFVLTFVFIGLPVLLALVDIVIVILLGLLGIAGRMLLRRPWTVEAVGPEGTTAEWRVVGWRASGELVREVKRRIEQGEPLPAITT